MQPQCQDRLLRMRDGGAVTAGGGNCVARCVFSHASAESGVHDPALIR